MKGINTPGQALDSGGVASFSAPRDGVSHLAFPALAPERNLPADSFPLAPLGNQLYFYRLCQYSLGTGLAPSQIIWRK
ncbi:hypothetical protein [Sphaerochaeta halotolerans]|uniref:hypothetical protein n=1 Tax=Sphaerochaeta halotolerans TaxID=2293840 RepID=UPI001058E342|nr:hypothetical protein [Sphaerochaeta halotolerans]MXI86548.1 hypothetical protein [Sphaerochaeta halotolerans]